MRVEAEVILMLMLLMLGALMILNLMDDAVVVMEMCVMMAGKVV